MFKYLFVALFKDDSTVVQNQEDKGSVEGKNCFYDVLQRSDELRAFALYNQETGEEWLVDLGDGHFEHNWPLDDGEMTRSIFKLHEEIELTNLRLIWFIKRQLILDVINTTISSNEIVSYNFGFQANSSDGKNHKFIISLS